MDAREGSRRRRLGLVCLVLGMLVVGLSSALRQDTGSDSAKDLVDAVSAAPGRWVLSWSLGLVGSLLVLPGLASLVGRTHGRGTTLTTVGGLLFGTGMVGFAALAGSELVLAPISADAGAGVLAAVDRTSESAALGIVFLLFLPGFVFGPPLLMAGLARAGAAPWWAFAAALVFSAAEVGLADLLRLPDGAASLLLVAAFASVVLRVRSAARDVTPAAVPVPG